MTTTSDPLVISLREQAATHVRERRIRRRNPIYTAGRFVRLVGEKPVEKITTEDLEQFRAACSELNYSPHGIESSIGDLVSMHFAYTGHRLDRGNRLKLPRPQPKPATLDQISAVYSESPAWLRQHLAVAYWTCLRVFDSLMFLRSNPDPTAETIQWTASKTGHNQSWPIPSWLRRHLAMQVVRPVGCPRNHGKRVLRRVIREAAQRAGVESFTPQQLRQRGLTEWSRANAMAASIVHGSGLGILNHYVDPIAVLESAGPSVRLPSAFASDKERDAVASLPSLVARLDSEARRIVIDTAKRFAR